jgi:MarR-like DNA-binding transcriptional regulator SgrR of sgrS sRNA
MSAWQGWRLRAEIALWRYGWLWAALIPLIIASLVLHYWWLPHRASLISAQSSRLTVLQNSLAQNRKAPKADVPITDDAKISQQLLKASYAPSEVSTTLKIIQQIAKAKGIVLAQSEFQTHNEGHGGLRQVQVTLPLRCTYPQLRDFTTTLLRQLPGISLDQVVLKRDNVALAQADIRLKLSIWVNPLKPALSKANP